MSREIARSRRGLPGSLIVLLVVAFPGCLTGTLVEALEPRTKVAVPVPEPANALEQATGVSVASVGTRTTLAVAVHRHDGREVFLAASLDSDEEPFAALDVAALPSSVVPVLFVANAGEASERLPFPHPRVTPTLFGTDGVLADEEQLARGTFVHVGEERDSRERRAQIRVLFPPSGGRDVVATAQGSFVRGSPGHSFARTLPLFVPTATEQSEWHPSALLGVILLAPLTFAVDLAFSPFELIGLAVFSAGMSAGLANGMH